MGSGDAFAAQIFVLDSQYVTRSIAAKDPLTIQRWWSAKRVAVDTEVLYPCRETFFFKSLSLIQLSDWDSRQLESCNTLLAVETGCFRRPILNQVSWKGAPVEP